MRSRSPFYSLLVLFPDFIIFIFIIFILFFFFPLTLSRSIAKVPSSINTDPSFEHVILIYDFKGWFSYAYCHGQHVRQFREKEPNLPLGTRTHPLTLSCGRGTRGITRLIPICLHVNSHHKLTPCFFLRHKGTPRGPQRAIVHPGPCPCYSPSTRSRRRGSSRKPSLSAREKGPRQPTRARAWSRTSLSEPPLG
jgi:hypothetical protein